MPNRVMDRLNIQFAETIYRMREQGTITESQQDRLLEMIGSMDDYTQKEFEKAWESVVEEATT